MKFRKSLIAAMLTGAGVIAVAPAINAAEYSTSVSGNIRVEGTTSTKDKVTTSVTSFGGEDDESNTGGDTFLQWNHNFANDEGTTTGGGFLRFTADGDVRINVNAKSELGNYKGELKAEWEQDGLTGEVTADRDQFAKLTNVPSNVYYKIGREQWLDNNRGYTSDFLSQTEKYAWVSGENRFAAHALGWSGSGVDIALLIQRDNSDQAFAKPSGQSVYQTILGVNSEDATDTDAKHLADKKSTADVSGFGILFTYAQGPAIVDLNIGSGSGKTRTGAIVNYNLDADDDGAFDVVEGSDPATPVNTVVSLREQTTSTSYTQLHLAFPVSDGRYIPFFNYGMASTKINGKIVTGDVVAATDSSIVDKSVSGWNLGASIGLGASDLVVAYGSQSTKYKNTDALPGTESSNDSDNSGFDLIWATNQEPLKVSLAYSSVTDKSQYGVRLDFGF